MTTTLATRPVPLAGDGLGHSAAVVVALARRGMARMVARPSLVIPTFVMPLFFIVSFTGAFSSLARLEGYGTSNVHDWMAPYAALQGSVFAGIGGASSAADDLENGFFDRLLLAPGSRIPILIGTATYSGLRSFIPTTAVLLASSLGCLSLRGGPLGLVCLYAATVGMAVVFCLLGLTVAYRMRTMRSMMLVQVVGFSSMFMSTGQVPLHFMEGWLRVVAGFNPMTDVLQFARQGFLGPLSWSTTWPGASALLLLILATGLAARRSLGKMAP